MSIRTVIVARKQDSVSVSTSNTFVTITDAGELKHADASDNTGVPVFDGNDSGNHIGTYVEIIDPSTNESLTVLGGPDVGNRIYGRTRAGSSSSPNSVEVEFRSVTTGSDLSTSSAYTWEGGQPSSVDFYYPFRVRIDTILDNDLRYLLANGIVGFPGGGGAGGGITENQHKALRHLIHFIDSGPGDGFASGAFFEILPAAEPFPTSYIWWESNSKVDKIVELTVTRNSRQQPITEEWKMYDTDGTTVLATVTDSINYSGPFELNRTRTIS